MKTLNIALLIIGGLNWLLIGLFEYDLVADIFGGQDSAVSRFIYVIVGICAIYAFKFFNNVNETASSR